MTDRVLSPEFIEAVAASGRSKADIVEAVLRECPSFLRLLVETYLDPGSTIPHGSTPNAIIVAICQQINLPFDRAFVPVPARKRTKEHRVMTQAEVDRRFNAALRVIRAQRWRLSEADIHARRGSPFGVPDKDEEAA